MAPGSNLSPAGYSASRALFSRLTTGSPYVVNPLFSGFIEYFNCSLLFQCPSFPTQFNYFSVSLSNSYFFLNSILESRLFLSTPFPSVLDTELRVGRGRGVRDEVPSSGPPICSRKALISFLSPTRVAPLLHATQLIRKRSRWGVWKRGVGHVALRQVWSGHKLGPGSCILFAYRAAPRPALWAPDALTALLAAP